MSRLHPVFNVVKLLPAPEDPIRDDELVCRLHWRLSMEKSTT
jgi:hypothetical protein